MMELASNGIFEKIRKERNGLASIHTAFGAFLPGVSAHYEFYKSIMLEQELPLSRSEREFLAWKTSEANQCPYCIGHHKAAFTGIAVTEISSERCAALEALARSITLEPWKSASSVEGLKKAGLSESELQHAVMVVSYFNFANRCAHAMGLELEPNFESTCN
jgi:uncharacterized peroxidase-related enzyme